MGESLFDPYMGLLDNTVGVLNQCYQERHMAVIHRYEGKRCCSLYDVRSFHPFTIIIGSCSSNQESQAAKSTNGMAPLSAQKISS